MITKIRFLILLLFCNQMYAMKIDQINGSDNLYQLSFLDQPEKIHCDQTCLWQAYRFAGVILYNFYNNSSSYFWREDRTEFNDELFFKGEIIQEEEFGANFDTKNFFRLPIGKYQDPNIFMDLYNQNVQTYALDYIEYKKKELVEKAFFCFHCPETQTQNFFFGEYIAYFKLEREKPPYKNVSEHVYSIIRKKVNPPDLYPSDFVREKNAHINSEYKNWKNLLREQTIGISGEAVPFNNNLSIDDYIRLLVSQCFGSEYEKLYYHLNNLHRLHDYSFIWIISASELCCLTNEEFNKPRTLFSVGLKHLHSLFVLIIKKEGEIKYVYFDPQNNFYVPLHERVGYIVEHPEYLKKAIEIYETVNPFESQTDNPFESQTEKKENRYQNKIKTLKNICLSFMFSYALLDVIIYRLYDETAISFFKKPFFSRNQEDLE